jgi:acyl dehydratase
VPESLTPRINDEAIAALRQRIGMAEPHPVPPFYRCPGEDAFRHVANAYGDDNPLWCEPAYGEKTRWGTVIASPALVGGDTLIGEDMMTPEEVATYRKMRGDPLRGVHAFYAASEREWWAPLVPGRRVSRRNALVGVLDKKSDFAGRAVHEWTANVFGDDRGTLLAGQYRLMIRTERERAVEKAEQRDRAAGSDRRDLPVEEPYSDEAIERIAAGYESERPRGNESRWFEDVEEGDDLEPRVKGPLTVTDMICWHAGVGMGLYGVAALRLGYQNRRRIPRFYVKDELGIPDVMQRVHWDPAFARRSGNPTTFDYGRMRETWLIHLCTDWMGDDAWLWRLRVEFRHFNYVGDTHWMGGRVVRKYLAEGDRPAVDLELWGRNQREVVTTPGTATILLPSRQHGPVRLPDPPGGAMTLQESLLAIAGRFGEE